MRLRTRCRDRQRADGTARAWSPLTVEEAQYTPLPCKGEAAAIAVIRRRRVIPPPVSSVSSAAASAGPSRAVEMSGVNIKSIKMILLPLFVEIVLTFVLFWWMAYDRVTLIRSRAVHTRDIGLRQT